MYKKLAQEQVSNLKQLNSQVEGPTVSTKELDEAKAIIKDRDQQIEKMLAEHRDKEEDHQNRVEGIKLEKEQLQK